MQDGDLSNDVAPRLLFIFEGTVGHLRDGPAELKEKLYIRTRRWKKALDCWEVADRAYALLWDVTWRYSFRFDIVTFRPPGFAKALAELFDEVGLPVSHVIATTPVGLAQRLAFMPDVRHVYDAEEARLFTWGGRGVHMPGGLAAFSSLW
jgi:hypothetical protein